MDQAEAEVKIELSQEEFKRLPGVLEQLGFKLLQEEDLRDFYLQREKQETGGWNFLRLRSLDGERFLLTQKTWVLDTQGRRVRREEERSVSREEFISLTQGRDDVVTLHKMRKDYQGSAAGMPAAIAADLLYLNVEQYYFMECEVLTSVEEAYETRERIKEWLKTSLSLQNLEEAPSMLEILER